MGPKPLDEFEVFIQDLVRQMKASGWDGQEFDVTIREEEGVTYMGINWEDEEQE